MVNHPKCGFGIVDIGRDPLRGMCTDIAVNKTRTLRTPCADIWLLPSNNLTRTSGAGVVLASMIALSEQDVDRAIGNTIPVPMMGCVMFPCLKAWQLGHAAAAD